MANFLYNGVELPALPTSAAERECVIYTADNVNYFLRVYETAGVLFYSQSANGVCLHSGGSYVQDYKYTADDGDWVADGGSYWRNSSGTDFNAELIWSRFDIEYEDGTVYLAASAPLRVDSKLKINVGGGANGDGYALYNGYKLPDITSYLNSGDVINDVGYLIKVDVSAYADGELFCLFAADPDDADLELYCATTQEVVTVAAQMGLVLDGVYTWSNPNNVSVPASFDYTWIWATHYMANSSIVNNPDLYSDPIPLDGYTVIEWDGNTEGLTELSGYGFPNLYLISDAYTNFADGDDYISVMWNGEKNLVYPDTFQLVYQSQSLGGGNYWTLGSGISNSVPFVASANVPSYSLVGTAFMYVGQGLYTNLFAYKATSSSGSITATTATVNFTCTDLENTEATDSIKAWVYKKTDGLDTSLTPTWTSELFAAPSYSASHTFTGLSPNTEYEVYGCIFVDGEATDHNALAAFTTLDGDGDSEEESVITESSGDGFALYNGVKVLTSEVPSGEEYIPLDGMTVIEWNGGTAGLIVTDSGFLYKITDDVLTSSQVIGGVFVQNVSSQLTAVRITTDSISAQENGIFIGGKIYSSPANTLAPEAGTYFPKMVGDYVSLFAYPNAADLKPVYKREGGKWVKKTAYERQNGEWVLISTS